MPLIERAIAVFYDNPDADWATIIASLEAAGFSPREAWELYQFLPIAFMHAAYRPQGVKFTSEYVLDSHGTRTTHRFVDEPIYVDGLKAAEAKLAMADAKASDLYPVFAYRAEYAALQKLVRSDGSVDGIGFVEPILPEYEE